MRKIFKRISIAAAAAVIAVSSAFFAGCDYEFTPLEGDVTGEVSSQGGFVVEIGEYVYFINGVEPYSSDNTYGTPVKGSLMRIKTADIKAGNNTAETVIPSLMVAGDYTSGIYIYNGRVYYATPNTVGNTQGEVDNTVLSFRSANLNGSDVQEHLRVADNATVYRYTAVDDVVYIVYETDGTLTSYNTETGTGTTLAENVVEYVLNSTDRTNPYIYYTMTVTDRADSSSPLKYDNYNQIYRVRADATEAPYTHFRRITTAASTLCAPRSSSPAARSEARASSISWTRRSWDPTTGTPFRATASTRARRARASWKSLRARRIRPMRPRPPSSTPTMTIPTISGITICM